MATRCQRLDTVDADEEGRGVGELAAYHAGVVDHIAGDRRHVHMFVAGVEGSGDRVDLQASDLAAAGRVAGEVVRREVVGVEERLAPSAVACERLAGRGADAAGSDYENLCVLEVPRGPVSGEWREPVGADVDHVEPHWDELPATDDPGAGAGQRVLRVGGDGDDRRGHPGAAGLVPALDAVAQTRERQARIAARGVEPFGV